MDSTTFSGSSDCITSYDMTNLGLSGNPILINNLEITEKLVTCFESKLLIIKEIQWYVHFNFLYIFRGY